LRDFSNKVTIKGRLQYAVIDKNKLKNLRAGFAVHRGSISAMVDTIHGTVEKDQILKLDQISKRQIEENDARRKETREILNRILNLLLSETTKGSLDTIEVLRQVEEELVLKGTSRERAREQLLPVSKALLQESGTAIERLASVSTSQRSVLGLLPASVQSPPTLFGSKEQPSTEDLRILCVDDSNGGKFP
jgi:hypothetical protein